MFFQCQSRRALATGSLAPVARIAAGFLIATALSGPGEAAQLDPHAVYEENCGGCHPAHASDFVYESMDSFDDVLVGWNSERPVQDMLTAGHGRLSAVEIDAVMELFVHIRTSEPLYKAKCDICHDRAVELARLRLILRDGVLFGRYTDREIIPFLEDHGRLEPDQVMPMVEMLLQQLEWDVSP